MSNVPAIVILALVVAMLIWLISIFNSLVALRVRVQNAWSEIDVQLKRRYDLIPNLVSAVQGYMAHERSILGGVTQARAQALAAPRGDIQQRIAAEMALTGALGKLFAVVESYPQLRAAESVQLLQEQLTSTENRIAYARQFYNDEAMKFNTAQATFPRNLFAGIFGFLPATMFAAQASERSNVSVSI